MYFNFYAGKTSQGSSLDLNGNPVTGWMTTTSDGSADAIQFADWVTKGGAAVQKNWAVHQNAEGESHTLTVNCTLEVTTYPAYIDSSSMTETAQSKNHLNIKLNTVSGGGLGKSESTPSYYTVDKKKFWN
jgi:hypothetical protein